jgi:two-component system, chemotaxis family, sensor kinase CheA
MRLSMSDFETELKNTFLDETAQLLAELEQCFLILENEPTDAGTLEKIFRIAHNIKGSAKAVGFDALSVFTHEFESFLSKCKSEEIPLSPRTISLLLQCSDHLERYLVQLRVDPNAGMDSDALMESLRNFDPTQVTSEENSRDPSPSSTVDSPNQELPLPPKNGAQSSVNVGEESIRVSLERLEQLLNFVGELVILQTVLKEQLFNPDPILLKRTVHQIGKVTKEVQDLSMGLRMVPVRQTMQKMQRIVRDTSSMLGKKVNLKIRGEDTEVDKTVLDALGDPLVHLMRNAVDHGIESAETRLARGKKEMGQIELKAYHQSGKLVIEVSDDGGGISAEKVRQKAIEKNILNPKTQVSDKEAIQLIFHSGFSTKEETTQLSGRGVGMDVVKTNIEAMQGQVLVETELGVGSTFRIVLPLTLAIIDGMVVQCGTERYVIPLSHVYETVQPTEKDLQFTTGMGEILMLRGENVPVVRLSQALGRRKRAEGLPPQVAIIVRNQKEFFATMVDDIVGQTQVVIKKLGSEVQHLPGFSGSAILGDGRPALILELSDLVASLATRRAA